VCGQELDWQLSQTEVECGIVNVHALTQRRPATSRSAPTRSPPSSPGSYRTPPEIIIGTTTDQIHRSAHRYSHAGAVLRRSPASINQSDP
jgi:hypothetical protein